MIAGTFTGLTIAATAPIVPQTQTAVQWEVTPKGCFAEYHYGEKTVARKMDCAEYWRIANTPNYPPPADTTFHSILFPQITTAAIAFDASSTAGMNIVSSVSFTHVVSGSNTLLHASVTQLGNAGAAEVITAATYNSVAMTYIRTVANGNSASTTAYYLINPTTGSNTVSFTFNAAVSGQAQAVSFNGAKQSGQPDASAVNTGSTDGPTVAIVTVADNSIVLDNVGVTTDSDSTVGAGQTRVYPKVSSTCLGSAGSCMGSTEGPKTPAGSVTMDWSGSSIFGWATLAVSYAPFIAPPPASAVVPSSSTILGSGTFIIQNGSLIFR